MEWSNPEGNGQIWSLAENKSTKSEPVCTYFWWSTPIKRIGLYRAWSIFYTDLYKPSALKTRTVLRYKMFQRIEIWYFYDKIPPHTHTHTKKKKKKKTTVGIRPSLTTRDTQQKKIEKHTAHTIVSWPNPKQWVIVYTSDLMMIIRQKIIHSLNHHKGNG